MNTTAQIRPPRTPSGPEQPTDPRGSSERRTFGEMLAEIVPLTGFVPGYGPPVVFVLAPWLFLVLMLAVPFASLFALVVVMIVAATVLTALPAAILAAPFLLVIHPRRQRARHASVSAPAAEVVGFESRRVAASAGASPEAGRGSRRRCVGRPVAAAEHQRLVDAFLAAALTGDLVTLEQLLAGAAVAGSGRYRDRFDSLRLRHHAIDSQGRVRSARTSGAISFHCHVTEPAAIRSY